MSFLPKEAWATILFNQFQDRYISRLTLSIFVSNLHLLPALSLSHIRRGLETSFLSKNFSSPVPVVYLIFSPRKEEISYVGRTTLQRLANRLYEHSKTGKLRGNEAVCYSTAIPKTKTFEARLIKALSPSRNVLGVDKSNSVK